MIASYAYCSKQIEFGVMAPSEMVQASEVQIYERTLYKVRELTSVVTHPSTLVAFVVT